MSLPHHISHLDLLEHLVKAYPNFPINPVEVNDVGDMLDKHYTGIHEVIFEDGSEYYVKNSDGLRKPFFFKTKISCDRHMEIYQRLKDKEYYHPDTKFICNKGEHGYRIIAATPAMLTTINIKRRTRNFPQDEYIKKRKILFSVIPKGMQNSDTHCSNNYGLTENGKMYYHDLHVLSEYPSPLVKGRIGFFHFLDRF